MEREGWQSLMVVNKARMLSPPKEGQDVSCGGSGHFQLSGGVWACPYIYDKIWDMQLINIYIYEHCNNLCMHHVYTLTSTNIK